MNNLVKLGIGALIASKIFERKKPLGNPANSCPKATYDLETNTKNRNAAIQTKWDTIRSFKLDG